MLHRLPQEIRRCPPGRVFLCSYTFSFVTFTSRRLQQHEKLAGRQGHPCLRFFHDFVTTVMPNFRSFCDTHKCKFLNSLIYIFFRDIYKWTLATNVKIQVVGKTIRACSLFMTLQAQWLRHEICEWRYFSTKRTIMTL